MSTGSMDPEALGRLASMGGSANEMGGTSSSIGMAGDPANPMSIWAGNMASTDPKKIMQMVKGFQDFGKPTQPTKFLSVTPSQQMPQIGGDTSAQLAALLSNPVGQQALQRMMQQKGGLLG